MTQTEALAVATEIMRLPRGYEGRAEKLAREFLYEHVEELELHLLEHTPDIEQPEPRGIPVRDAVRTAKQYVDGFFEVQNVPRCRIGHMKWYSKHFSGSPAGYSNGVLYFLDGYTTVPIAAHEYTHHINETFMPSCTQRIFKEGLAMSTSMHCFASYPDGYTDKIVFQSIAGLYILACAQVARAPATSIAGAFTFFMSLHSSASSPISHSSSPHSLGGALFALAEGEFWEKPWRPE